MNEIMNVAKGTAVDAAPWNALRGPPSLPAVLPPVDAEPRFLSPTALPVAFANN